jgi:hypothetical protein
MESFGKGGTARESPSAFSTTEHTYFDLNSFRKLIERANFAFTPKVAQGLFGRELGKVA